MGMCDAIVVTSLLSTFLGGASRAVRRNSDQNDLDRTAVRILDAALTEATSRGLAGVSVEGIARSAGVNRATIYRRFGDREGLLAAFAALEGERMACVLLSATSGIEDPEHRLIAGFVAAVSYAHSHPVIARAARLEPASLIEVGLAEDARLLRLAGDFVAAELRHAQKFGRAMHLDADLAGETFARLFASLILLPGGRLNVDNNSDLERYARSTLVPMLLGVPTAVHAKAASPE